jgi:hypothetical protein
MRNVSAELAHRLPRSTRALQLSWCPGVSDKAVRMMAQLPALEWLYLDHPLNPQLSKQALAPLTDLPGLWGLSVRARPEEEGTPFLAAEHLAPLAGIPLRSMSLVNHPGLEDLSRMGPMPQLTRLDLSGCPVLRGLSVVGVETLFMDARRQMTEDTWEAIGRLGGLTQLSVCNRSGAGALLDNDALEVVWLYGSRGLAVRSARLQTMDLGETPIPPAEALAHCDGLGALRLPGHRLSAAHLGARGSLQALWIEGGAPKLKPDHWAGLQRCERLTLACALKLNARHLKAIAALKLSELHILKGAERLRPRDLAALGGLGAARWIHLDGCRDVDALRAALPGTRVTTEPSERVSR